MARKGQRSVCANRRGQCFYNLSPLESGLQIRAPALVQSAKRALVLTAHREIGAKIAQASLPLRVQWLFGSRRAVALWLKAPLK